MPQSGQAYICADEQLWCAPLNSYTIGCGTVDGAVVSDTKGPGFKHSHGQLKQLFTVVNCL